MMTLAIIFLLFMLLIILGLYVYYSFSWYKIAKKLGYKHAWIAWIPLVQAFLFPILAKKRWYLGFLIVLPTLLYIFIEIIFADVYLQIAELIISGSTFISAILQFTNFAIFMGIFMVLSIFAYILIIIWTWKIFERRNYPGYFSLVHLILIIPFLNFIGVILYLVVIGFVAFSDRKDVNKEIINKKEEVKSKPKTKPIKPSKMVKKVNKKS